MSSLEAAHDILHPLQKSLGFPWKQNISDRAHYPQFMCMSLLTRDGERDRRRLNERIKALKNQDKTNPLVSDTVQAFKNLPIHVPAVWDRSNLDIREGEIRIVDFPSRIQFHSKAKVLNLLEENVSVLLSAWLSGITILTYPSALIEMRLTESCSLPWKYPVDPNTRKC